MIVFIKTHGRPDKQYTYETLRQAGYKEKIFFVVDDEDNTRFDLPCDLMTDYIVFRKQKFMDMTDSGVSNPKRNVNLYAWNACEYIGRCWNDENYIMADDDITGFRYRYFEDGHLKSLPITMNIDKVLENIFEFMTDGNICSLSTGMPQMYFDSDIDKNLCKWRVPYQFVFRNRKFDVNWIAEYEEDIITAIEESINGKYMMCFPIIQHNAVPLGKSDGGMKETYDENKNRFRLAEFGHVWHPSCEQIAFYKDKWISKIQRDKAFSKLISSSFKK